MSEKRYCPECGEELNSEYIYETGDTLYTCPNCDWEGGYGETEDEEGHRGDWDEENEEEDDTSSEADAGCTFYKRINKNSCTGIDALSRAYEGLRNEKGVITSSDSEGEFILVPTNLLGQFVVTTVCRDDFITEGYDAQGLSDGDMEDVANTLEKSYTEDGLYWDVIRAEAERLGLSSIPSGGDDLFNDETY